MKICLVRMISRSEFLVVLGLCSKLWLGLIRSQKQSFVLSEAAHTMLLNRDELDSRFYTVLLNKSLEHIQSISKYIIDIAYPHTPHCIESGEMMSDNIG